MTDDESLDTDNRRERLATRRRRVRILSVVLAIVLVGVGVGTAFALRDDNKSSAATTTKTTPNRGSNPVTAPNLGKASKLSPPRSLSHTDPMRLWIGGDSLAGSFGPALGQIGGTTGVVDATIDYKVSSGLADQGIRDWEEHAQQVMTSETPDAVVFIIGTNDASIVNTQDSNNDGVADWEVSYRAKIDRMMETFVGTDPHRTVFWLGPPTMRDNTLDKGTDRLGQVMKEEAAKYSPDVVYVDTYSLFADANGNYSESLPDKHGNEVQMRISDGAHFTVDGAQYLAGAVWKLINKRWGVTKQADPANPISYTIAQGSGESVPGVGRYRPGGSSGQSSSSTTTAASSASTTTSGATSTSAATTTVPPSSTTIPTTTTVKTGPTTTTPVATTTTH